MVKTQEVRNRERDKRLQKNYRWTLERRNRLSQKQYNRCGICGCHESEFTQPLQLDHEHFRIETRRVAHGWLAKAVFEDPSKNCSAFGKTKARAIADVRDLALPISVRGLLCPGRYTGCNRLLGRVDKIKFLENALAYIKNPPAKGIL